MKIQFMAALAVSSMFALTACSDDESSASLADKCETLTEDCLEGTWTLASISSVDGATLVTPFKDGSLTFNDDGTYSYVLSSQTSNSACAGSTISGKWELVDQALTFKTFFGDCALYTSAQKVSPDVEVESDAAGDKATLNLKKVIFQSEEATSAGGGNFAEIFTRVE